MVYSVDNLMTINPQMVIIPFSETKQPKPKYAFSNLPAAHPSFD